MNIYDIAKLSGVSIATVSRVVNGSSKVSAKTRGKVMKVIEENGYTPNVFAQGLGLDTMHTVGILVPTIADSYMSLAVYYCEQELHKYGYDCILGCSGFDLEAKKQHAQMLLSKRIDALILIGSTYASNGMDMKNTDYIREAASSVPVFIINGAVEGRNIYCSVSDDKDAIYKVTSSLLEQGRKNILFLTDSHSYSALLKLEGFNEALKEHDIDNDGSFVLNVPNRIHPVKELLLQKDIKEVDAIIATNDDIAVGAIKFAKAKGLRIPEDISIVGYNNSAMSIGCDPELTSIDNKTEQICRETVARIFTVLQSQDEGPGEEESKEKSPAGAPFDQITTNPCSIVKRGTTNF